MKTETSSFVVVLGRIFWMILGPLCLFLLAFALTKQPPGWFRVLDLAFFALLGSIILVRWLEFRSGRAQTATGEPATAADLRKYTVMMVALGFVVWIGANLLEVR